MAVAASAGRWSATAPRCRTVVAQLAAVQPPVAIQCWRRCRGARCRQRRPDADPRAGRQRQPAACCAIRAWTNCSKLTSRLVAHRKCRPVSCATPPSRAPRADCAPVAACNDRSNADFRTYLRARVRRSLPGADGRRADPLRAGPHEERAFGAKRRAAGHGRDRVVAAHAAGARQSSYVAFVVSAPGGDCLIAICWARGRSSLERTRRCRARRARPSANRNVMTFFPLAKVVKSRSDTSTSSPPADHPIRGRRSTTGARRQGPRAVFDADVVQLLFRARPSLRHHIGANDAPACVKLQTVDSDTRWSSSPRSRAAPMPVKAPAWRR